MAITMNEKRAEKLGYLLWKINTFASDWALNDENLVSHFKDPLYSYDEWLNSTASSTRTRCIDKATLFMKLQ